MNEDLVNAMGNLDEETVLGIVKRLRDEGAGNISIMYILNRGMLQVGKNFEAGVYYLADLIVSGAIYRQALELLGFDCSESSNPSAGKVLIGVVKNDIHDIGKDIIVSTLKSDGFEVIDLGVDVPLEDFIAAIIKHKPDILALGGTMSFALDEMQRVILELERVSLRGNMRVIVGGVCVNKSNAKRIGADYYSEDPIEALEICKKMMEKQLR